MSMDDVGVQGPRVLAGFPQLSSLLTLCPKDPKALSTLCGVLALLNL